MFCFKAEGSVGLGLFLCRLNFFRLPHVLPRSSFFFVFRSSSSFFFFFVLRSCRYGDITVGTRSGYYFMTAYVLVATTVMMDTLGRAVHLYVDG